MEDERVGGGRERQQRTSIIFIALFFSHFLIIFIQLFLQLKACAEAEDEARTLAEASSVGGGGWRWRR